MTLKKNEKFEERLTCRFKIDLRNLANFDSSTGNLKNFHFKMGCFLKCQYLV